MKPFYFIRRGFRDILNPLVYEITEDLRSARLGSYYFAFNRERLLKGGSFPYHIDSAGLPMIPVTRGARGVWQYHPIAMGQYGLAVYHDLLHSGEELHRKGFLRIADWFVENVEAHDTLGAIWRIRSPFRRYGLSAGWISAMAQGRAMSILARAHQLTGHLHYIDLARGALRPFEIVLGDGGIRGEFRRHVCFEEYPADPAPHVLNGMIFAMWGLFDLVRAVDDPLARKLWEDGLESIRGIVPFYDAGFWTRYSVLDLERGSETRPHLATRHYHHIHIRQLEVLRRITGDSFFGEWVERWKDQDRMINRFRVYVGKLRDLE